jgi:hypothetical protein
MCVYAHYPHTNRKAIIITRIYNYFYNKYFNNSDKSILLFHSYVLMCAELRVAQEIAINRVHFILIAPSKEFLLVFIFSSHSQCCMMKIARWSVTRGL